MQIPIYVVTGFLDAGKTTLLNKLLNNRELQHVPMLMLQFEAGEEEFTSRRRNCAVMNFPKRVLEQNSLQIIEQVHGYLLKNPIDEIWVEWNGVTPLAQLQALFLHPALHRLCRIEKVLHMADAGQLENLLGRTGGALPEQMASCDFAVVRDVISQGGYDHVRRIMRSVNPGVKLLNAGQTHKIYSEVYRKRRRPVNAFCAGILLFVVLYLLAVPVFELSRTPVNTIINLFLGIMLQALPFLLIGVLISSAIQVFISPEAIERRFPKKTGPGMLAAILCGFCLPVCDCASIPIFRSLVRKGVPLPAAVTFMTATPVINPVVMLSTYYAFNGNLRIVAARVGLGMVTALLIGLWFAVRPHRARMLSNGFDSLMCSCGCYEGAVNITSFRGKLNLFIRHSQAEFFNMGKYLMIGSFVASIFQITITKMITFQKGTDFAASLLVMMATAFLLSLCSSSDAVIARSFGSMFPLGAVMGFMVFGPMLNIRNVIMLSGGFSKRFIGRLLAVAFTICFLVIFLFARLVTGG